MPSILINDFVVTLFIFLRILSAFIAAPIFGGKSVPMQIKILLSAFIAYLIFYSGDFSNIDVQYSIWFLIITAIKEIATGLVIGFSINLIFYAVQFAGSFVGFDMGLTMAMVMNPMQETNSTVIGEIMYYGALLIFLLLNGHQFVIEALFYSFHVLEIGGAPVNKPVFDLLMKQTAAVFILSVKISSPILVSFFLINLAEGVTARAMPQMQVFFVTQPLKLGLGFILLAVGTPLYINFIKYLLETYESSLIEIVKAMG